VFVQLKLGQLTCPLVLELGQLTCPLVLVPLSLGGIGGYIAEEFARLGVKRLILIDGDRIEESNLNRQIIAHEDNLGELKVTAAKNRLQKVNSKVIVDIHAKRLDEENGRTLIHGATLVCDAIYPIFVNLR